jgi:hypothetical protein
MEQYDTPKTEFKLNEDGKKHLQYLKKSQRVV